MERRLAQQVAWSGIAQKGSEPVVVQPENADDAHESAFEYEDPGVIPEQYFNVPGFVSD